MASLKSGVKRVAGPSSIREVTCLVLAFFRSSTSAILDCSMKDTIDLNPSSVPDASHLSFIIVYQIQAFFLHYFIHQLPSPTTLLISYNNTRTLLMLWRSRPAFVRCTVLL